MAWVKIDDRYGESRKVRRAWRRDEGAIALHVLAMTHCALHETDGLVELDWLEERMPDPAAREERLALVVELGLFEKLEAGARTTVKVERVRKGAPVEVRVAYGPLAEDAYLVHDYLEFNEARQEAQERRRAEKERKTRERRKSAGTPGAVPVESEECPAGQDPDTAQTPSAVQAVSRSSTRPDPTRPDQLLLPPSPPKGGRKRDRDRYEADAAAWAAEHFPDLHPNAAIGYAQTAVARGVTEYAALREYVEVHTGTGAHAAA